MRPNFLLIGANKGGTTTLFNYLKNHPDIFVTDFKEPSFFIFENRTPGPVHAMSKPHKFPTTLEAYEKMFEGVTTQKAIGECSTGYLTNKTVIPRIKELLPDVKIIAVLRNPVDRAYSNYRDYVGRGIEHRTFKKAIHDEMAAMKSNQPYEYRPFLRLGLYADSLSIYMDTFGRDKVHIILFEELAKDPLSVAKNLFRFLEVDDTVKPDVSVRRNVSDKSDKLRLLTKKLRLGWLKKLIPRSAHAFFKKLFFSMVSSEQLTPEVKKELREFFLNDINKLEVLINRDLSSWKK